MTSLLLVEDEESLAESLAFTLTKYGYEVHHVPDGLKALEYLQGSYPDLILLDIMLPEHDGFEVCRAVQKLEASIPIIIITARGSETDRVVGLELGADDYVVKPFSTRELEARIKAVLRRKKFESLPASKETLEIDFNKRSLKRSGQPVDLSPKEWEILKCLVTAEGHIVTKDTLLGEVWGADFQGDPKTVEVYIHWLRQKLEADSSNPVHILTVKGQGYRFEA